VSPPEHPVPSDAAATTAGIPQTILEPGADYLLAVKANQAARDTAASRSEPSLSPPNPIGSTPGAAFPAKPACPAQPRGATPPAATRWPGSQLALVHIGDTRAYLLREGELFQITHDHTLVQSMVDEGRLSADEAASHPQRELLMRALHGVSDAAADIRLHDARPGDRYLLCSDGLSSVVPAAEMHRVVSGVAGPDQAVRELVALANRPGGPHNVSCVVADVLEPGE